MMGIATMIWDTISGGVIIAAKKKQAMIAKDLPFTSHFGFNNPNCVRITDTTGISKTIPKMI